MNIGHTQKCKIINCFLENKCTGPNKRTGAKLLAQKYNFL